MRKRYIVLILLLCAMLYFSWMLYDRLITRRSPEYIHAHVTPTYEEKARDYYDAHAGELARLVALLPELMEGRRYDYPCRSGETDVPEAMLGILEELWQEDWEHPCSICLTRENIDIWFATGTCFDVCLVYGDSDGTAYGGSMPDWEKNIPLERGWMIQAPYILRG